MTDPGTYRCKFCGMRTHDTGRGEVAFKLCRRCLLDLHIENAIKNHGRDSLVYRVAVREREAYRAVAALVYTDAFV